VRQGLYEAPRVAPALRTAQPSRPWANDGKPRIPVTTWRPPQPLPKGGQSAYLDAPSGGCIDGWSRPTAAEKVTSEQMWLFRLTIPDFLSCGSRPGQWRARAPAGSGGSVFYPGQL
jgi:hypothetical protein